MADYQNLSERDLNQINGSSSALGEGSFKRRDELRRAESLQRNKIKMGERLDRSINRAVRKGDARAASAFNDLRQSISGQGFGGNGGIGNAGDRDERVKDGVLKGADFRHGVGNIGNTALAEGPIANAPPPVDKPQGSGPLWDSDNSGILDSIQRPVAGPQTAPEGVQAQPAPPITRTESGGLTAKRSAVAKLTSKWKAQDPASIQDAYEVRNGTPEEQSRSKFAYTPELGQEFQSVSDTPATSEFASLTQGRPSAAPKPSASPLDDLSNRMGASIEFGKKSSSDYTSKELERVTSRDEGMAKIDQKLQKEYVNADRKSKMKEPIFQPANNSTSVIGGALKDSVGFVGDVFKALTPELKDRYSPEVQAKQAIERAFSLEFEASQMNPESNTGIALKNRKLKLAKELRDFSAKSQSAMSAYSGISSNPLPR